MQSRMLAVTASLFLVAGSAFAGHKSHGTKKVEKPDRGKMVEVNVCPMTGEKVVGKGSGSEAVGKYNVHFCCAGCQPNFDKLSQKEKEAKIEAAMKKETKKA